MSAESTNAEQGWKHEGRPVWCSYLEWFHSVSLAWSHRYELSEGFRLLKEQEGCS